MRIAIINRFSIKFIDYQNLINESDEYVIFTTNPDQNKILKGKNKCFIYEGFDKNFYLDIIEEHKFKKFDKIIATSEYDIERAAELRDLLKVEGLSYNNAILFRDKFKMKDHFQKVVKVPNFMQITKWTDVVDFINKNNYPVILKPTLEAGSEGIFLIKNKSDLSDLFKKSPDIFKMIIEAYVPYDMFHADGFYVNKEIKGYMCSKYINNGLSFSEGNYLGSIVLDDNNKIKNEILKNIFKIFDNLNLNKNIILPFHAEFFENNDEVLLCEIAIRMGGGNTRDVFKLKTGLDFLELDIKAQIYDELPEIKINKDIFGYNMIINKKGKLLEVDNYQGDEVIETKFDKTIINKSFDTPESWADYYISYIIKGKDFETIKSKLDSINEWQIKNTKWELN